MIDVGAAGVGPVEVFQRVGGVDARSMAVFVQPSVLQQEARVELGQALDQFGSRVKAITRSSAQGHPSAMRKVVRRAERTSTPAVCKSV